jgi:hypothetical protein
VPQLLIEAFLFYLGLVRKVNHMFIIKT